MRRTACDGEEALQQLIAAASDSSTGGAFSLALVDLQMPLMDGMECVRRLRAWEAKRVLPVHTHTVAVSANSDDAGCHDDCLAAGFDAAFQKPLSMERILVLLRHVKQAGPRS